MNFPRPRSTSLAIAALLTAGVLLGGCSAKGTTQRSTAPDGDVVTTYDDPNAGLRITYPGNWQEQPISVFARANGTTLILTVPSDASESRMPPTFNVVVQPIPAAQMQSSEEHLQQVQSSLIDRKSREFNAFELIESESTFVGVTPARRVVYRGRTRDLLSVNIEVMNVIAMRGGKQYAFSYTSDPDYFPTKRSAIESLIASIQFVP